MPRVSVIIPAFNSEQHIRETIESVLRQTCVDFEIVVVDDGSTDNTASIVAALRNKRIRLTSKVNGGTASARNVGVRISTGEYLQFLDADDLILPNKLTRQVDLLSNNPSVDVVYSSFRNLYHDRCDLHAPDWLRSPSNDPYRELVRGSIFPPHAALVRRSSAEAIGLFDTELISAEDWDFWIRLARADSGFLFHDDLLALYRQHATSKTKRLVRWRRAHVQVMEKIRISAEGEQELRRIDWYYHASFNYALWALALMLEDDTTQACHAIEQAYALDAGLGHAQETLARRVAEFALMCDARGATEGYPTGKDGAQFIDILEACLPNSDQFRDVAQTARTLYWLARAHQSHSLGTGKDVRRFIWHAFRNGGGGNMNRGTLSILVQSFIGQDNWRRLKGV